MRFLSSFSGPVIVALCFLFMASGDALLAAPPKKPTPPPDRRKLIKSVDAKTNSIVVIAMYRKQLHTYTIDGNTVIQVNGAAGTFAGIKPGMEVTDSTERDADTLDMISVVTATQAPVVPSATAGAGPDKTIDSVLPEKNAVVIFYAGSKMRHTYHLDASTTLTVNGNAGKFTDIEPGMEVKDYEERDNDDLDSLTLVGYGTPAAPATPAPAKKK